MHLSHSFAHNAVIFWNELPVDIRTCCFSAIFQGQIADIPFQQSLPTISLLSLLRLWCQPSVSLGSDWLFHLCLGICHGGDLEIKHYESCPYIVLTFEYPCGTDHFF